MEKVLVIAGARAAADALSVLARAAEPGGVRLAGSGGEGRRLLLEQAFSLIVISAPLPDESGELLAAEAAESTQAGVILITPACHADEIAAQVEGLGVLVLPRPLRPETFYRSLRLVEVTNRRLAGLREENARLRQSLEELRFVGRAKAALMQHRGMSERQAHRAIEKQAMDLRLSRREVAETVLQAYRNVEQEGGE